MINITINITNETFYYLSNAIGIVGVIWAVAFIIYCKYKYKREE